MSSRFTLAFAALVIAAGCGKSDKGDKPGAAASSDCARAVHHVLVDLTNPAGAPPPSEEEAGVIKQVVSQTVPVCEKEGLSKGQLDCIFAAKTAEDFPVLARCPAIVAKKPSWIILPTE